MLTTVELLGNVFFGSALVLWAVYIIGMGASLLVPEGTLMIFKPKFSKTLHDLSLIGIFTIALSQVCRIIVILNLNAYLIELGF